MMTGTGYCPAGPVPSYAGEKKLAILYRAVDQAQRQRPSVRTARLRERWLARLLQVERFGPRDFQGQRWSRASSQGFSTGNYDARHTSLGNMRRRSSLQQLRKTISQRLTGQHPFWRCTTPTRRLQAVYARRLRSFQLMGA